jgi:putative NIF3 family GTP cyclohydrolase 1 type 2
MKTISEAPQEVPVAAVCNRLDQEFNIAAINDDWSFSFDDVFRAKAVQRFLEPNKNTGLFLQFGSTVSQIYTAFAPSHFVLQEIKRRGIRNALLVLKHPFDWDGSATGQGFLPLTEADYQVMREMGLSLYSLHTPWDKNRNDAFVSTAYGFAKEIGFVPEREFAADPANPDVILGLIGTLPVHTFDEVSELLQQRLGYKVKSIKHHNRAQKVALVTGGGFIPSLIQEAKDAGCDLYITGIISANASEWSKNKHTKTQAKVEAIGINVIGASHYLTEKFAPQHSLRFFKELGLPAAFIEDNQALEKLE